jgi:hypothetical protein
MGMRLRPVAAAVTLSGCVLAARDAPAGASLRPGRSAVEPALGAAPRAPRRASWASGLAPIGVRSEATKALAELRLYADDGSIDERARAAFEAIATREELRPLAERLEQLVFKTAYHFARAPVIIVSGWRANAGRHGTGEALDFKLQGVAAWKLAAYLRGLPRAGVGIYTHPRTQFVHLDVRDASYHWIDASPPGVKWPERQLRDPHASKRDAAYTLDSDLP